MPDSDPDLDPDVMVERLAAAAREHAEPLHKKTLHKKMQAADFVQKMEEAFAAGATDPKHMADALLGLERARAELVEAARAQLANNHPTDGHVIADRLARLVLEWLGEQA